MAASLKLIILFTIVLDLIAIIPNYALEELSLNS